MKTTWIAIMLLGVSLTVGVVFLLLRPASEQRDVSASEDVTSSVNEPRSAQITPAVNSCIGHPDDAVSRKTVREKYRWVHTLLNQRLFDAALPELREIAALDPGYPGINLDISTSLVQLGRSAEAKSAIDSQIAVSDCLSKLPMEALDEYCRAESPAPDAHSCRMQLSQIQQAAQLESAVIHVDLAQNHQAVNTAAMDPRPRGMPTVLRANSGPRKVAAVHPAVAKTSADKSLVDGDGTDSALGAYSKP